MSVVERPLAVASRARDGVAEPRGGRANIAARWPACRGSATERLRRRAPTRRHRALGDPDGSLRQPIYSHAARPQPDPLGRRRVIAAPQRRRRPLHRPVGPRLSESHGLGQRRRQTDDAPRRRACVLRPHLRGGRRTSRSKCNSTDFDDKNTCNSCGTVQPGPLISNDQEWRTVGITIARGGGRRGRQREDGLELDANEALRISKMIVEKKAPRPRSGRCSASARRGAAPPALVVRPRDDLCRRVPRGADKPRLRAPRRWTDEQAIGQDEAIGGAVRAARRSIGAPRLLRSRSPSTRWPRRPGGFVVGSADAALWFDWDEIFAWLAGAAKRVRRYVVQDDGGSVATPSSPATAAARTASTPAAAGGAQQEAWYLPRARAGRSRAGGASAEEAAEPPLDPAVSRRRPKVRDQPGGDGGRGGAGLAAAASRRRDAMAARAPRRGRRRLATISNSRRRRHLLLLAPRRLRTARQLNCARAWPGDALAARGMRAAPHAPRMRRAARAAAPSSRPSHGPPAHRRPRASASAPGHVASSHDVAGDALGGGAAHVGRACAVDYARRCDFLPAILRVRLGRRADEAVNPAAGRRPGGRFEQLEDVGVEDTKDIWASSDYGAAAADGAPRRGGRRGRARRPPRRRPGVTMTRTTTAAAAARRRRRRRRRAALVRSRPPPARWRSRRPSSRRRSRGGIR